MFAELRWTVDNDIHDQSAGRCQCVPALSRVCLQHVWGTSSKHRKLGHSKRFPAPKAALERAQAFPTWQRVPRCIDPHSPHKYWIYSVLNSAYFRVFCPPISKISPNTHTPEFLHFLQSLSQFCHKCDSLSNTCSCVRFLCENLIRDMFRIVFLSSNA